MTMISLSCLDRAKTGVIFPKSTHYHSNFSTQQFWSVVAQYLCNVVLREVLITDLRPQFGKIMVLHVWLMLFSDTDQRHCSSRSVGFLNLPTRRSFKLAKRTAIVCAQAPVSQAVLCGWTSVLHRVLVTLLTTAKWRTSQQDHHKFPVAWKMAFRSLWRTAQPTCMQMNFLPQELDLIFF